MGSLQIKLSSAIETKKDDIQQGILSVQHGLFYREFSWRKDDVSIFHLLVAEVLLKRTTATSVSRIYLDVVGKYQNVAEMAEACKSELMVMLRPLGLYNQRSKSLIDLAKYVVRKNDGNIPSTLGELLQVPGLGEYSARAVLSFGYSVPAAIVDSNVIRIMTRVFQRCITSAASTVDYQGVADRLLPVEFHKEYNYCLLDVGSQICRPVKPLCERCPIGSVCDYKIDGAPIVKSTRVGIAVRTLRQKSHLSQVCLASMAKISKRTLVQTETGKTRPSKSTLRKLAKALNVNTGDLDIDSEV